MRTYVLFVPRRRPHSDLVKVEELKAAGATDREASQVTGVPVNTIRGWRKRRRRYQADGSSGPVCPRCGEQPHDFGTFSRWTYAYLLGLYLGDGWISRNGRSWTLCFALDSNYP